MHTINCSTALNIANSWSCVVFPVQDIMKRYAVKHILVAVDKGAMAEMACMYI